MRMVVMSRELDTIIGLRFAGIDGVLVKQTENAEQILKELAKDEDVGVILLTETIMNDCADLATAIKNQGARPLISLVPDRSGKGQIADSLSRYVQEAIGIKL